MREVLRNAKWHFALNILLKFVAATVLAYAGYSLSFFVDILQDSELTSMSILRLGLFELAVWSAGILLLYISDRHENFLMKLLRMETHKYLVEIVKNASFEKLMQDNKGTYMAWFSNDVKDLSNDTFRSLLLFFQAIFTAITGFVAILKLGYPIAVTAVIMFLVIVIVPQFVSGKVQKKRRGLTEAQEFLVAKLNHLFMGIALFFTGNKLHKLSENILDAADKYEESSKQYNDAISVSNALNGYSSFVSQLILLTVTAVSVFYKFSPIGAILGVGNLSGVFFNGVGEAVQNFIKFKSSRVVWKKFEEKLPKLAAKPVVDEEITSLSCKNLSFAYNEDAEDISYKDICIEKGKKYFLAGANGTGKSTLLKLFAGFYSAYKGELLINSERELKDVDKLSLWRSVDYMYQDPYLFADTLRNNLTMWDDSIADEAVWEVLRKVDLADFVADLDGKLQFEIGENATNLSGGQRQRLVLARTLLRKNKYIFVDEATSNIDAASKKIIMDNLLKLKDTAVVVVDHSLPPTVQNDFDAVISL